jgi:hypothetical protein
MIADTTDTPLRVVLNLPVEEYSQWLGEWKRRFAVSADLPSGLRSDLIIFLAELDEVVGREKSVGANQLPLPLRY